jgi:hypothetical protein
VLVLVIVGTIQSNLLAQSSPRDPIPKDVLQVNMGTTWKKLVLANPGYIGLNYYSFDMPIQKADPDKPKATLVQRLPDGSIPLVYTFNDLGILVMLTFYLSGNQSPEAVLSELNRILAISPEITEKQSVSSNNKFKIYTWREATALEQLYVSSNGKLTFIAYSLEFAKKAGLL